MRRPCRLETGAAHSTAFERGAFHSLEGNSNDDGSREGVAVVSNLRGQIGDTRRYLFNDWEALCK
jgi:hypothetical protein